MGGTERNNRKKRELVRFAVSKLFVAMCLNIPSKKKNLQRVSSCAIVFALFAENQFMKEKEKDSPMIPDCLSC